ncbi:MAG: NAD-dependent deacylase [Maricaulaceae bacterium]
MTNLVVLTGAGVSAGSGLGTFRDAGGLWARFDPYQLATPEGFARDPALVHEFYNVRRRATRAAQPNPAHQALARLEADWAARRGDFLLVTQNIDDLHQRAGSRAVTPMHGEILKARCEACGGIIDQAHDLDTATACPLCANIGTLRPHVVWFGEVPLFMDQIGQALARADLFVAIGTSGSVYPAAGFVALAKQAAARTVELNLEPSDNADAFDEGRYGPASQIVPDWVDGLST